MALKMGTWRRQTYDVVSILLVSVAVIAPQWYLALNPQINLGIVDLLGAVVLPIAIACILFLAGKRRILLYAFLAYIWALTEDAPVYLDSVFTWPEVTSGFQHLFLEILVHALTLVFMALTVREAIKGTRISASKSAKVALLVAIAFIFSYAQNLPIDAIQDAVVRSWYELDIIEHLISVAFLWLAVRESMKSKITATPPVAETTN